MKKIIKNTFLLAFMFLSTSIFAQNKSISAEKVEEGIKVTTTENGETSSTVFNLKDANKYLEQFGENIDFNIEELGENKYEIKYNSENGNSETVEIDIAEMLENMSINFESLGDDLTKMIENISSQIDYEETIDKDGNKVYKIKTLKLEK